MDTVADLITRIKNANRAGKGAVTAPYSKMGLSIAELLEREGFVRAVRIKERKNVRILDIALLKDAAGRPRVCGALRVSKPSRRQYFGVRKVRPVKHGGGRLVISTPKGIMTGEEAKKTGVGGEPLFIIW